jgi:hypothetical protein
MTYRGAIAGLCAGVVIASAASASAQSAKKPGVGLDTPNVHGFSVTLVLGDMQGTSSPDNLPVGAKKALADMRDFLPYKSYRLLDTQWILCCGSSKVGTGVSGRLRGVSPVEAKIPVPVPVYSFAVTVLEASGPQLSIRFVLNDGAEATKSASQKLGEEEALFDSLARQREMQEEIERKLAEVRKGGHTSKHPMVKDLESQLNELMKEGALLSRAGVGSVKGAVLDSTFSMNIGETVVIGTSSLKGEKALIALLTAVRRPGPQSETMQGGK